MLTFNPLSPRHDRKAFACGDDALDRYLAMQAGQDAKKHFASIFVCAEEERPGQIVGFYSLSAASILSNQLPEEVRRKLPRYDMVPAALLGRLAVSQERQGQKIGISLVMDALANALASPLAWAFFLVSAKNERVSRFYQKFKFLPFAHDRLFLWANRKQCLELIGKG